MKKVVAIVDMQDFSPKMRRRTHAFHGLCTLLMQLGVFDSLTLKCDKNSGKTTTWVVDRERKEYIIR